MSKRTSKPLAEWERLSPQVAEKMLEVDGMNRKLSDHLVKRYAAEMKAGRWDEDNGETIKVGLAGNILDGQHRLWAIVESGVTMRFLVVRGVDDDAFKTIDIGKQRTVGDITGMSGVKSANSVSAAGALVMAIKAGKYALSSRTPSALLLKSAVIDFVLAHKSDLEEAVRIATNAKVGKVFSNSNAAGLVYLFGTVSKADRAKEQAVASCKTA